MVNVVETPLRHEKELPLEEMRHRVVNSLQIMRRHNSRRDQLPPLSGHAGRVVSIGVLSGQCSETKPVPRPRSSPLDFVRLTCERFKR